MDATLTDVLNLVGKLDDSPGDDAARERFRRFLRNSLTDVGQVRDYVEECLRKTGDQYARALQDLVNHLGRLLGFDVEFGRYQGVRGRIGHDGLWTSPSGFHLVIEVKTTEAYAIKTATLVGYADNLISEQRIPNWGMAMGLYVVGRPDPEIRQLENAIVAEHRTHQLRIISVDALVSLAEMMSEYDVSHDDVLALLRPSGPSVDAVVGLMARLVAQRPVALNVAVPETETPREPEVQVDVAEPGTACWMTPVRAEGAASADDIIARLVGREKIYAFGERTPGRKHLKPGDRICFYATGKGVVADARVATKPELKPHPAVQQADQFPWTFRLQKPRLYLDQPVVIDAALRAQLDAFQGRDPERSWAWFVQATSRVSDHDFEVLTRKEP